MTTYLWCGHENIDVDKLTREPGFQLRWGTRAELCDPYTSPFAYYNTQVFRAYDVYLQEDL